MDISTMFFPKSIAMPKQLQDVVKCFNQASRNISSTDPKTSSLYATDVLAIVRPHLQKLNYDVEITKNGNTPVHKIKKTALYGQNNKHLKDFAVDAISADGKIIVEVMGGTAVNNYVFLYNLIRTCMIPNVEYLVLATKEEYDKNKQKNYDYIMTFMEAIYASTTIKLPLKGVLVIGY